MSEFIVWRSFPLSSWSLGLSNHFIPDSHFGASSSVDVYYRPGEGRLNNSYSVGRGSGAWCSGSSDVAPYLQVNLSSPRRVTQVSTQGHPVLHKWVTLFRLSYSLNGVTWTKVDKVCNSVVWNKHFKANWSGTSVMKRESMNVKIASRDLRRCDLPFPFSHIIHFGTFSVVSFESKYVLR